MLLNVRSDGHFQKYLDGAEQKLFVLVQPILQAAINVQASSNSVRAHDYVVARGTVSAKSRSITSSSAARLAGRAS